MDSLAEPAGFNLPTTTKEEDGSDLAQGRSLRLTEVGAPDSSLPEQTRLSHRETPKSLITTDQHQEEAEEEGGHLSKRLQSLEKKKLD